MVASGVTQLVVQGYPPSDTLTLPPKEKVVPGDERRRRWVFPEMVETNRGGGWGASAPEERIEERKVVSACKAEGAAVKRVGEAQVVLVMFLPSRTQLPPNTPPKPRNLPLFPTLSARIAARDGGRCDGISSTGEVRRVCEP